jgi:hypothetical protein
MVALLSVAVMEGCALTVNDVAVDVQPLELRTVTAYEPGLTPVKTVLL